MIDSSRRWRAAGVAAASRLSRALGRCFGGEAGRVYLTGTRRRRALNVPQSPQRQFPRHASTGTANTHQMGAANKTAPTTQRGRARRCFSSRHRGGLGLAGHQRAPKAALPDGTRVAPVEPRRAIVGHAAVVGVRRHASVTWTHLPSTKRSRNLTRRHSIFSPVGPPTTSRHRGSLGVSQNISVHASKRPS